jgi:hypothetical protein
MALHSGMIRGVKWLWGTPFGRGIRFTAFKAPLLAGSHAVGPKEWLEIRWDEPG